MALTKARPPVTAISEMLNGTTNIDIPSAGADIDVNVAGVDVLDISQTAVVAGVDVTADTINGETVNLNTTAGSSALLRSGATENALLGSTAHPFVLGANALNNLILNTDGTVTLGADGTAATHLVDKDYVDTAVSGSSSSTVATLAVAGGVLIPTDVGDLIFKWGRENSLALESDTVVTFPAPFPNTCFMVFLSEINTAAGTKRDNTVVRDTVTASQFTIWHPDGAGSLNDDVWWFAIGF